ncbi:Golgi to ER traffic protein 4 homolog [Ruditapes philippinarum]|uniref:Golgi to ER traffic protein 4 homolog n=1 Tax=Ruditapes philippinarum TaxID=129788 RepID=UPI00295BDBFE|nr:Golgi to ER traffic protein 4 homolog [Ruditapes philippinarum]
MAAGVQRVLAKCQKCIDSGNFYEAHQMYRTLYFRYSGAKKYAEAIDLLYNGSQTLLHHKQYSSGTDLALLLIDVLNTAKTPVSEDNTDKVVDLLRIMDNNECPDRLNYLNAALRWTISVAPECRAGHPDLHKKCGMLFWQEKNYVQARYHYLHSSDGKNLATMLIEYQTSQGYPSEVDLFIAQTVLQFLCLQNKDTAHVVFVTYTKGHPDVKGGPPYIQPLLNFIWFLLLALEGGKLAVFAVLCEKYQTAISRDPTYKEYLDKIGQLFFGVPAPKSQSQGGFFGNLIQSLLGNEDGEENSPMTPAMTPAMTPVTPSTEQRNLSQVDLD